ncbi:MAG: MATE family efflux transporter, partial [Clostridiales bacterium]|nr:MATE family efflux transporter [Clostridiales bacterium]
LRAVGNSRTPLYFLVIASIVNVILDLIFVAGCSMGVKGAAVATVCSQVVSLVMSIVYIVKKCPFLWVKKSDFVIDKTLVNELFSTGLSMALMFSIVNFGTVILQYAINDFGKITIAAHTTARKISGLYMLPGTTLTAAVSTFTSQNYGARRYKRIKQGVRYAFVLGMIWVVIANLSIFLFGKEIVRGVSGSEDTELIELADWYLRVNLPYYLALIVLSVLRSVLQGIGLKLIPLVSSSIELIGKLLVVLILVQKMGYYGVIISEPIIWIVCSIVVTVAYVIRMRKLVKA